MKQVKSHFYDYFWDEGNYRIIACKTCGFKHIYPIPETEELEFFYQKKYYNEVKPFPYNQVTPGFINATLEWVANYQPYIDVYNKVMELKKTTYLSMIDIGCGNDLLVKYFQYRGWEVSAIEPSKDAGEYLGKYDIQVYDSPVERISQLGFQNAAFVNLQFVLEHLREPYDIMQKVGQIMAPGGLIRVCVPNDFGEGQMAYVEYYQERHHWICLPDHINYFTYDSLSDLLRKSGFQEVYRTTNFPLEILLMGGINYYASEEERKKVNPFVTNFEQSLIKTGRQDLLGRIYENLAQMGLGRSIIMYALKNNSSINSD